MGDGPLASCACAGVMAVFKTIHKMAGRSESLLRTCVPCLSEHLSISSGVFLSESRRPAPLPKRTLFLAPVSCCPHTHRTALHTFSLRRVKEARRSATNA